MKNLINRLLPFAAIFMILQTLVRLTLALRVISEIENPLFSAAGFLAVGFLFDICTLGFLMIPLALYWLALPSRWHGTKGDILFTRVAFGAFLFVMVFSAVSEHFFWDEFSVRFNFIAVDYLVYTNEVIGNIYESYPVIKIISAIVIFCAGITFACRRYLAPAADGMAVKARALSVLALLAAVGVLYSATSLRYTEISDDSYVNELAANGIYNLFWAYKHNEIDYRKFYLTHDDAAVKARVRELLKASNSRFEKSDDGKIIRDVFARAPEQHKNVILVSMESMSASYMEHFGSKRGITPNLDKLADQGLLFTKFYATGTRTVRGLEALSLSLPPTPGQSILRRPGNENLFSIGSVFRDRGYDTSFIYGGYGYFDNMNYFFANNGFDIIDRTEMKEDEINFANVWGVADDDMFMRAIREGDKSYAAGKPFFQLIMTTSNHRPYTYPDGKIDIPSKSGREGGVKYADYSVGVLVAEAKKKPWFKNTLFVFVADHTAGAGGKVELSAAKYHIPLILYAPGFIRPGTYDKMASQIDVAPIILGKLNFSYRSRFMGQDLLNDPLETPRAFISNYQKVALMKNGQTAILVPKRGVEGIIDDKVVPAKSIDPALVDDAVAYYQHASDWRENSSNINSKSSR